MSRPYSFSQDHYIWRILLIDDDEDDYVIIRDLLAEGREGAIILEWASSFEKGQKILCMDHKFDAIIVDNDLGLHTGIEIIREAVADDYPAPVILLTGRGRYEVDIEAMQAGAADYLCKGEISASFLERAIRYAITEKKNALELRARENSLKESDQRYRNLFNTMLNGFALHEMIFDAEGKPIDYRFLEINPSFEALTGLNGQMIIGKTVREILPDIETEWIERYGKVAVTGEPVQFHSYSTSLNRHYQVYAFSPQKNHFAAIFSDITERILTEKALRESEERFRALFENRHSIMLLLDPDTAQIVDANPAACAFYGWSREEMLRMKITDINLLSPIHVFAKLSQAHASSSSVNYNFRHRLASGEIRDVEVHSGPVQVGGKRLLFSIISDITEHLQIQQSLHQSEQRERIRAAEITAMMDVVPAMIWISRDAECMEMIGNRYGYQFLHMGEGDNISKTAPESNLKRQSYRNFKDGREIPTDELPMQIAAATGQATRGYQYDIVFADGSVANLYGNIEPLFDEDGKPSGAVAAFVDITESRRNEAQRLEYTTQMEVHHRLLEQREMERQQVARLLHDGPLQGLLGLMYEMKVIQDLNQDGAIAQKLDQLGGNAKQLVSELRNLCYELRPPAVTRFGLPKAIRSYAADFQQVYPVTIRMELVEDCCEIPDNINLAFYRIFQEGLRNIQLHASAKNVIIRLFFENNQLFLQIEDDGIGFDVPDDWVEFARLGLFGFVSMNERAEAILGKLRVMSQPNQGTLVQVSVPFLCSLESHP